MVTAMACVMPRRMDRSSRLRDGPRARPVRWYSGEEECCELSPPASRQETNCAPEEARRLYIQWYSARRGRGSEPMNNAVRFYHGALARMSRRQLLNAAWKLGAAAVW